MTRRSVPPSLMTLMTLALTVVLVLRLAPVAFPQTAGGSDADAPVRAATVRAAIDRGVAILLERQESLGKDSDVKSEWPYEGVYRVRDGKGTSQIPIGYRVGGTSICGRAIVEAPGFGRDPQRQEAVKRALTFVLAALADPRMNEDFTTGYDVRNWGHIYALDFLVRLERLKCVPNQQRRSVSAAIRDLVSILAKSEIPGGGWNYSRRGARPSPSTFMTAPAVQALLAADAAGYPVDADLIVRALDTLDSGRLDTGAYQYTTRPRKTGQGFEAIPGAIGRMAVCESTLLLAGRGDIGRLRSSIDAFFEHWEWLEKRRRKNGTHVRPYMIAPYYFYYAHRYVGQAIELLPDQERRAYRARLQKTVFSVQEDSGGWNDRVFDRSENFGTAMVILALLSPEISAGHDPAGGEGEARDH